MNDEYSESGNPIYRHEEPTGDIPYSTGDGELIDAIVRHMEKYIGPAEQVFHELISDWVHVDLHWIKPAPGREFHTIFTTGMSEKPMNTPPNAEHLRYAELMICLPISWDLEHLEDEANYWVLRWLKILARMPHQYNTWLAGLHTIPHGDPPQPFAPNTKLCCTMLAWSVLFDENIDVVQIDDQRTVHIYTLIPIYKEEMEFKLKHGGQKLLERLSKVNTTELLNVKRPNVGVF
jgi:hypothetical protein